MIIFQFMLTVLSQTPLCYCSQTVFIYKSYQVFGIGIFLCHCGICVETKIALNGRDPVIQVSMKHVAIEDHARVNNN